MKRKASKFFTAWLTALSLSSVYLIEANATDLKTDINNIEQLMISNEKNISELHTNANIDPDPIMFLAFCEMTDCADPSPAPAPATPSPQGEGTRLKERDSSSLTGPSSEGCVAANRRFTGLYEATTTPSAVCARGSKVKQAYLEMTVACEVNSEEQQQGLSGMDAAIAQSCATLQN